MIERRPARPRWPGKPGHSPRRASRRADPGMSSRGAHPGSGQLRASITDVCEHADDIR
jgi:hypothetical protein